MSKMMMFGGKTSPGSPVKAQHIIAENRMRVWEHCSTAISMLQSYEHQLRGSGLFCLHSDIRRSVCAYTIERLFDVAWRFSAQLISIYIHWQIDVLVVSIEINPFNCKNKLNSYFFFFTFYYFWCIQGLLINIGRAKRKIDIGQKE